MGQSELMGYQWCDIMVKFQIMKMVVFIIFMQEQEHIWPFGNN